MSDARQHRKDAGQSLSLHPILSALRGAHPRRRAVQLAAAVGLTLLAASAAAWVSSQNGPAATTVAQLGDATPARGARDVQAPQIDRAAARALFGADAATRFDRSVVPVLAPETITPEQAARFATSFRATPDGYFGRLPQAGFDVVINGTRAFAVAPPSAGAPVRDMSEVRISQSETGLAASFSRYGADYEVEFACRGAGDELGARCLSAEEARALVDALVPVGGGDGG